MTDLRQAALMAKDEICDAAYDRWYAGQHLQPSSENVWRAAWRAALEQSQPEPVAWLVCSVNKDGSLSVEHAAAWQEAAHEHINDAITEYDIEGAASWVVRPAYIAPVAPPPAQAEPQEDAHRWRYVRDHWDEIGAMVFPGPSDKPSWASPTDPALLTAYVDQQRKGRP